MNLKCLVSGVIINSLMICNASANEKLIFAIDIIRHGDRTPAANIPTAPHQWKEGLGQLTATGMHQENLLGETLRKVYVDQYHLLPSNYTVGTIYVRSSDFDRTLMSAQSFLMGLYPLGTGPNLPDTSQSALPAAYQPIPIHTLPQNQETLLIPDSDAYKYGDLLKRYVHSTAEWKAKNAALQPKFSEWSRATGVEITELDQLQFLADTLYVEQLYHIPPPSNLRAADVQQIIDAGEWAFVTGMKNNNIGRITGHQLLKTIADYLQQASEGKTQLKYVLFSAHDSTLLSQMSAMGVPLDKVPHYASDLNIGLFEQGYQSYYVKIKFNNKEILIPSCGGTECSLEQFIALAK